MIDKTIAAAVLVLGAATVCRGADVAALPRLAVHPDGHYLMTSEGKPFFWLGDTAWELFHRLNREEAVRYLDNRAKLGYNVVQAVCLAELDGVDTPDAYGHLPLVDRDPSRPAVAEGPDDDYWDHVDFVVREANRRGIYVAMLPTWGRWWKKDCIFTPERAAVYGEWLGRRYRDAGLVWVLGGDRPVETDAERAIIEAMAAGLRRGDGGAHLVSFHPNGGAASSRYFPGGAPLDFHMRQNGHTIDYPQNPDERYAGTLSDWRRSPAKPVIDAEPVYEGHPVAFQPDRQGHTVAADIRRAFYWDVFNGAFGHTYGHHSIWQMYDRGRGPVNRPLMTWSEALDEPGARQLGLAKKLFESRAFFTRVPAPEIIVASSPASLVPGAGTRRFAATRDSDGSFAMVYAPVGRPFKVDLSCIRAPRCRVAWFDPRTGEERDVRYVEPSHVHEFTPPAPGELLDWVLVADAADASAAPGHPRLFADDARFAELRCFCAEDPDGQAYLARLLATADAILAEKPVERVVTGRRLLDVSRTALARITHLVFAWRLTRERRYADRGVAELKAVCGFSDWHPDHYLDTGEMALAAAIAYDGFHLLLPGEDRSALAKAIAVRSLETWNEGLWWVESGSNWNAVCNAGTLAACWALWDDPVVGELARKTAAAARRSAVYGFECYGPSGAYPEGPMYWGYGTSFACLETELVREIAGSDAELSSLPGFSRTCEFLDRMTSPGGGFFDFGDGHPRRGLEFPSFYLAWRFNRPETLARHEMGLLRKKCASLAVPMEPQSGERLFPLIGLYLDQDIPAPGPRPAASFWYSGENSSPCCSLELADGTWLAVHGGKATAPHMHMDVGGFVYEAKGRRFVLDYGMEPYHNAESRGIQIWDGKVGGKRWECFRLGPEAHAIVRIDGAPPQADAFAPFTAFETNALPYRISLDLTAVYPQARRVTRTFELAEGGKLTVRDTLEGLAEGAGVAVQFPLARDSYRLAADASPDARRLTLVCAGAEAKVTDQQTRLAGWELAIPPSDRVDFVKRAGKDGRVEFVTELIPPSGR